MTNDNIQCEWTYLTDTGECRGEETRGVGVTGRVGADTGVPETAQDSLQGRV